MRTRRGRRRCEMLGLAARREDRRLPDPVVAHHPADEAFEVRVDPGDLRRPPARDLVEVVDPELVQQHLELRPDALDPLQVVRPALARRRERAGRAPPAPPASPASARAASPAARAASRTRSLIARTRPVGRRRAGRRAARRPRHAPRRRDDLRFRHQRLVGGRCHRRMGCGAGVIVARGPGESPGRDQVGQHRKTAAPKISPGAAPSRRGLR